MSKLEPRGEPRVIRSVGSVGSVGSVSPRRAAVAGGLVRACLGCGYDLSGLPGDIEACPECGRSIEDRPAPDPIGGVSVSEARAGASGAAWALAGLFLVAVVPVVGAVVDAVGWWLLTSGPGKGRRSAARVRGVVRALTVLALVGQLAMWWTLGVAYVGGGGGASTLAAEVTAGSVATVAIGLWTLRHVVGCWWVGRFGRRVDVGFGAGSVAGSIGGLAATSGVGAALLSVSGVVLIGLGVIVSHLALFPPLCFALPLWVAGLAAWGLVTAVLFVRVRGAMRAAGDEIGAAGGGAAGRMGQDAGADG